MGVMNVRIVLVASPVPLATGSSGVQASINDSVIKVLDLFHGGEFRDTEAWWSSTDPAGVMAMGLLAQSCGGRPLGIDDRLREFPWSSGEMPEAALQRFGLCLSEAADLAAAAGLNRVGLVSHAHLLALFTELHHPNLTAERLLLQMGRPDVAVIDHLATAVTFSSFWKGVRPAEPS